MLTSVPISDTGGASDSSEAKRRPLSALMSGRTGALGGKIGGSGQKADSVRTAEVVPSYRILQSRNVKFFGKHYADHKRLVKLLPEHTQGLDGDEPINLIV